MRSDLSRARRIARGWPASCWRSLALVLSLGVGVGSPAAAEDGKRSGKQSSRPSGLVIEQVPVAWHADNVATFGHNDGPTRLALGRVVDSDSVAGPNWLGTIEHYGRRHKVVFHLHSPVPRQDFVRSAVGALLERTGLLASPGQAGAATVHVTVHSSRVFALQRWLAAEVFLEVTFEREGATVGRVLALGNAKDKSKGRIKRIADRVDDVYQAAMDDALWKLVSSETLRRLVGQGWRTGEPAEGKSVEHLDWDGRYGPTPAARETLPRLRDVLAQARLTDLRIEDLDLGFGTFALGTSAERARSRLPDRLRSYLLAVYPGAFERVVRGAREVSAEAPALVLAGRILEYDSSGQEQRFALDIDLRGGGSGTALFTLHIDSSRPARGANRPDAGPGRDEARWVDYAPPSHRALGPHLRDLEGFITRDLAYLLAMSRPGGYRHPENTEVRIDGTP